MKKVFYEKYKRRVLIVISLNCIKQLCLKDHICLSRHFLVGMLYTHAYDITFVKVDHGAGSQVFPFLLVPSSLSYDPKQGFKISIFQGEMMQFHGIV